MEEKKNIRRSAIIMGTLPNQLSNFPANAYDSYIFTTSENAGNSCNMGKKACWQFRGENTRSLTQLRTIIILKFCAFA